MAQLSTIVTQLDDAIAAGWAESKASKAYGSVVYLDAGYAEVQMPEELEILRTADVLAREGRPVRAKLGDEMAQCIIVLIKELRKKAQAELRKSSREAALETEVRDLKRQLKLAHKTSFADEAMARILEEVGDMASKKLAGPRKESRVLDIRRRQLAKGEAGKRALAGIPTFFLSDWHWGEMVDPEQVEGMNEFNLTIARERGNRMFFMAQELLLRHLGGQHYEGICIPLGGDMFSGNIHQELRETNEKPIAEAMFDLIEFLTDHIVEVAKNFPFVYVPCVIGNHGRMDVKARAKNGVMDNFDYMLYKLLEKTVTSRCDNVKFDVPRSEDLTYDLYGTRYLLTHGFQSKGGSGVGGIWPSLMKMNMRKKTRAVQAGRRPHNIMILGHFHQYGVNDGMIVNGSLKGVDEWTYSMNFGIEPPTQALWVTHPDLGITQHFPVFGETPERNQDLPPFSYAPTIKRRGAGSSPKKFTLLDA